MLGVRVSLCVKMIHDQSQSHKRCQNNVMREIMVGLNGARLKFYMHPNCSQSIQEDVTGLKRKERTWFSADFLLFKSEKHSSVTEQSYFLVFSIIDTALK
jgi:hypothetical protein